ncbi:MAG: FAD-binding oxidoreductase [Paracoccaceae bacterium]|nr:FAD-binding oxidoreductase [Paracoccaceae bacterium]
MLNPVSDALIERLRRYLGPKALREIEPRYLEEPRGRWAGRAGAVIAPDTAEGVAEAVKAAGEARVPVVPYGGGTGLVGGQIMPDGPAPLVLSLERMTRIREVFPDENVIVVEAGATLAAVQEAAAEADRLFPLSYASEGSARIGGALSVNSGGLNVLRYGTARDLALGIEAVLPNGEIFHGLKRLRKDNTGYDLRHLLIGAEGTLGVITAASLRLVPRPARVATALMVVPGPEAALRLYVETQSRAEGTISAFEIISGRGFEFLDETGLKVHRPFADIPAWSVLVELGAGISADPEAVLEAVFAAGFESGLVTDGVVAASEAQRQDLWHIRETIPEANRLVGAIASHDISLPLSDLAGFVAETDRALTDIAPVRINAFGHLGDGNLHYNLFPPHGRTAAEFEAFRADLSRLVYDNVVARGGSISAEHGVGRLKPADIARYGDPARLGAMRAIKAALDPLGIMNPGVMLPAP